MTKEEIIKLFNECSSKLELCQKLNIPFLGQSGTTVNKMLDSIAKENNIEIDLTANGFKKRRHQKELEKWQKEQPKCKFCGKVLPFEKRFNKFCNQHCAVSFNNKNRTQTLETRKKISKSLHKYLGEIKKDKDYHTKICCICGKRFSTEKPLTKRLTKRKTCSEECHQKLISENSKRTYQKLKEEGRFVGWKTRNLTSYAEKFWIKVLDNNKIQYIREKKIDKYFLDFYITKNDSVIDLEIDGKQHKYEDRKISDKERDEYLQSIGILTYRIPWNSINKEEGKQLMKEKIDKFLEFYNSI